MYRESTCKLRAACGRSQEVNVLRVLKQRDSLGQEILRTINTVVLYRQQLVSIQENKKYRIHYLYPLRTAQTEALQTIGVMLQINGR